MSEEDAERLMTAIQPALVQHFFGGTRRRDARELRAAGTAMARAMVRIRGSLGAESLDDNFLIFLKDFERSVMDGIDDQLSQLVRSHCVKSAT